MSAETAELIEGEFREPHNGFQQAAGSIHNDEVASKLGFKGGTVPGSVHMSQFAPMLVSMYGEKWFKRGNLSFYFTQATVDREKVRAVVRPDEPRADLRMYNEAGDQICVGTAMAEADDDKSAMRQRMDKSPAADIANLRILKDYKVGDKTSDIAMKLSRKSLDDTLTRITENLPLYARDGVLPPSTIISIAHQARPVVLAKAGKSVGLFGALEIRNKKGPLLADHDYVGRTTMLKLTDSPKTESAWYDVDIADAKTGEDIATVMFMIRFMKASSPLWT